MDNCVNRIEVWSELDGEFIHHEMENDVIEPLVFLTKMRGEPIAYGVDLTIKSKSDAFDAINLLEKILIEFKNID